MLLLFQINEKNIVLEPFIDEESGDLYIQIIRKCEDSKQYPITDQLIIPHNILENFKIIFDHIEAWKIPNIDSYINLPIKDIGSVDDSYENYAQFEISSSKLFDCKGFSLKPTTLRSIPEFEIFSEDEIFLINSSSTNYFHIFIP